MEGGCTAGWPKNSLWWPGPPLATPWLRPCSPGAAFWRKKGQSYLTRVVDSFLKASQLKAVMSFVYGKILKKIKITDIKFPENTYFIVYDQKERTEICNSVKLKEFSLGRIQVCVVRVMLFGNGNKTNPLTGTMSVYFFKPLM